MSTALSKVSNARISFKDSLILCKQLKGMKVEKAKKFLENLIDQKVSIERKYYTKASEKVLEILKTAEANAKQKNLNLEKLFIKIVKPDKGEKFIRPKSRFKFRGKEAKSTNIEIILEER
jgi:large subunit ribosomal protein L22